MTLLLVVALALNIISIGVNAYAVHLNLAQLRTRKLADQRRA